MDGQTLRAAERAGQGRCSIRRTDSAGGGARAGSRQRGDTEGRQVQPPDGVVFSVCN